MMAGMKLNHIVSGENADGKSPILLVHGLFGQARNLGGLARRLAVGRQVISVDMRNHGDSPHSAEHSYAALAGDLAEIISEYGGKADVAGHSMGGKSAMALALSHPEMVGRLAVLDIAPVAYTHSQNAYIDAMEAIDLAAVSRRSQADEQMAKSVPQPGIRAFLLQSLDLKSDPPRWKLNLPVLRDQMPVLVGWPDDLPSAAFGGPALFIAGADSDYVNDAGRSAIRDYFPQGRLIKIKDAGHWLHADAAEATAEALAMFFKVPQPTS